MKKKTLLTALTTIAVVVTLSSCGSKEHTHSYDTKNIDWGWIETSTGDYRATATFSCTGCSESTEGHSVTLDATIDKTTVDSTCSSEGRSTYVAKVTFENKEYSDTHVKTIAKKDHTYSSWVITETSHYHECEVCHEHIDEATHTISEEFDYDDNSHWKPCEICGYQSEKTAHTLVEVVDENYKMSDATCLKNAVYYKHCSVCLAPSSETFEVPNSRLGHQLEYHEAQEPASCGEEGYKAHYTCKRCGEGHYYLDNDPYAQEVSYEEIVVRKEHKMTKHEAHDASCDADGNLEYYTCSNEGDTGIYKDIEGKEKYTSLDDTIVPAIGHDIGEDGMCTHCKKSLVDALDLKEATKVDTLNKTLSESGFPSPYTFTDANKYGTYNFLTDEGFSLTFRMNYSLADTSKVFRAYIFNKQNEDGGIFRINFSRKDDDGIVPCNVYISNAATTTYGSNTTIEKAETGKALKEYYFPRISGIKSNTNNVFNIRGTLIDKETETYRLQFRGGVEGGIFYNLSANAEDKSNTPLYFDIELGSGGSTTWNKIRLNSNSALTTMQDVSSLDNEIVLKNEDGTIYGKRAYKIGDKLNLPTNIAMKNKKFIGWFNSSGEQFRNRELFNAPQVLTARYVDSQANMLNPSDFGYDTKDKWFTTKANTQKALAEISKETNRLDLYFMMNIKAVTSGTEAIIFGFPCTNIGDNTTAINFRFDARTFTDGQGMRYYQYSASKSSIGGATEPTNVFRAPNISLSSTGSNLLVHLSVTKDAADATKVIAGYEVIDMRNGEKVTNSREVVFTKELDFLDPDCMKFAISTDGLVNGDYAIRDLF